MLPILRHIFIIFNQITNEIYIRELIYLLIRLWLVEAWSTKFKVKTLSEDLYNCLFEREKKNRGDLNSTTQDEVKLMWNYRLDYANNIQLDSTLAVSDFVGYRITSLYVMHMYQNQSLLQVYNQIARRKHIGF